MRLPVVRLIALREIRDLLRDRRSLLLILVMPLVIYPFFGLAGFVIAKTSAEQVTRIGIVGSNYLPAAPKIFNEANSGPEIAPEDLEKSLGPIEVVELSENADTALRDKQVDVVLIVPADFQQSLKERQKPKLRIDYREGEEKSKLAARRLRSILNGWKSKLKVERFKEAGLPEDFDELFTIDDPNTAKPKLKLAADEIRDSLSRALPFILMMWLVAGAIQPAVDLTAGEKERGTMETLLISPAERREIVFGKFLAVSMFSFGSVVWNTIWLTIACSIGELFIGYSIINKFGLIGCVILGFPMAMLFSAICIALGVFARSTKEGQYYLLPLILLTMPLAFWSMMPGKELDFGTALVPVTGAMLLQQKLLVVTADPIPWVMFGPVLGGLILCVTLALWIAVRQFHREDVLFREADDSRRGLGRLFGS